MTIMNRTLNPRDNIIISCKKMGISFMYNVSGYILNNIELKLTEKYIRYEELCQVLKCKTRLRFKMILHCQQYAECVQTESDWIVSIWQWVKNATKLAVSLQPDKFRRNGFYILRSTTVAFCGYPQIVARHCSCGDPVVTRTHNSNEPYL